MNKEWDININNRPHKISYLDKKTHKQLHLLVDGKAIEIPQKIKSSFLGVDFPIFIDGVECRFVSALKGVDLVVDGNFVENKKQYIPLKIPVWCWLFVLLSALIPVVSIGGAIPMAIACLSSIWCLKVAASPFINFGKKLLYNVLLVLCAWLLFGLLIFGIS